MYCAIIGDIIDSRSIKNREEVQKKLNEKLNQINEVYQADIVANFLITLGDEFQGLLKNPQNLIKILLDISMELYPIKIRYGIGFGEINTKIIKDMAIGADGPVYHMARKSIQEIKDKEKKYEKPYQNIIIHYDNSHYTKIIELINATLSTCALIESKWSAKQRKAIRILIEDNTISLQNVANELKVSKSSIHRRLSASGYYTYIHALDNIIEMLVEIWRKENGY